MRHGREIYSTRQWKRAREAVLRRDPWCVHCKREDPPRVTAAEEVDHIRPLHKGGKPYDMGNLQGLCRFHHSLKTARENTNEKNRRVRDACAAIARRIEAERSGG